VLLAGVAIVAFRGARGFEGLAEGVVEAGVGDGFVWVRQGYGAAVTVGVEVADLAHPILAEQVVAVGVGDQGLAFAIELFQYLAVVAVGVDQVVDGLAVCLFGHAQAVGVVAEGCHGCTRHRFAETVLGVVPVGRGHTRLGGRQRVAVGVVAEAVRARGLDAVVGVVIVGHHTAAVGLGHAVANRVQGVGNRLVAAHGVGETFFGQAVQVVVGIVDGAAAQLDHAGAVAGGGKSVVVAGDGITCTGSGLQVDQAVEVVVGIARHHAVGLGQAGAVAHRIVAIAGDPAVVIGHRGKAVEGIEAVGRALVGSRHFGAVAIVVVGVA